MFEGDLAALSAAALAAFAVAALVFVVLYPYFSGERQKEVRYRVLADNRARMASAQSVGETAANRRKAITDSLKELETREKTAEKVTLRLRLQMAGLKVTPKVYWLASVVCGLSLALLVNLTLPPSGSRQLLAVVAALVGTFGLPRWVLSRLIKRRQGKFLAELANAVDIVVRGVKSGLPLNECLATISRESAEPLASEFREVVEQQRIGVSLSEALERLTTRMPLPEVKYLTIVIAIQQQAGGNLSEALSNLAGVLRDRFRLKMKVKALSAEAKASALVLASLPPAVMFMVYGASPDYIMPLFATRTGNLMLVVSAVWMMIGVLVMRKMINFKF
jgi:tight adherence protein B